MNIEQIDKELKKLAAASGLVVWAQLGSDPWVFLVVCKNGATRSLSRMATFREINRKPDALSQIFEVMKDKYLKDKGVCWDDVDTLEAELKESRC